MPGRYLKCPFCGLSNEFDRVIDGISVGPHEPEEKEHYVTSEGPGTLQNHWPVDGVPEDQLDLMIDAARDLLRYLHDLGDD